MQLVLGIRVMPKLLVSVSRRFKDELLVYWPPWDARKAEVLAKRGLEGGSELLLVGFQLIVVSGAYKRLRYGVSKSSVS